MNEKKNEKIRTNSMLFLRYGFGMLILLVVLCFQNPRIVKADYHTLSGEELKEVQNTAIEVNADKWRLTKCEKDEIVWYKFKPTKEENYTIEGWAGVAYGLSVYEENANGNYSVLSSQSLSQQDYGSDFRIVFKAKANQIYYLRFRGADTTEEQWFRINSPKLPKSIEVIETVPSTDHLNSRVIVDVTYQDNKTYTYIVFDAFSIKYDLYGNFFAIREIEDPQKEYPGQNVTHVVAMKKRGDSSIDVAVSKPLYYQKSPAYDTYLKDAITCELNKTYTFTNSYGFGKPFLFTPKTDGMYVFTLSTDKDGKNCTSSPNRAMLQEIIHYGKDTTFTYEEYSKIQGSGSEYISLNAGQTYMFLTNPLGDWKLSIRQVGMYNPLQSMTLPKTKSLKINEVYNLYNDLVLKPSNPTNVKLSWKSSNAKIVSVDKGDIKAVSYGTATITATSGNFTTSCKVTVNPAAVGTTFMVSDCTYQIKKAGLTNGEVAFVKGDSYATTISIPNEVNYEGVRYIVTSIGSKAVRNNTELKTLTIGNNITTIGKQAFYGCKNLKKATIGVNVATVGKQAFYGCEKLKSLTIKTTKLTSKSVGSKAFSGTYKKMKVKVPKTMLKKYKKLLKSKGISKTAKIKK